MESLYREEEQMPQAFGAYTILGRWAAGGMAEIYVARKSGVEGFDRLVALKILREELAQDESFRQMFFVEARTSALLRHSNIIPTFDVGMHEGRVYLAMDFVNGEPLNRVMSAMEERSRGLSVPMAVWIAQHIASALEHAHTLRDLQGRSLELVHRDVNPSNIMLTQEGEVKLLDFGVAKVATSEVRTQAGVLKGKVAYLSPEQASRNEIDGRADVFSLGVVLWQMLTGRRAFDGQNEAELLAAVLHSRIPAPSKHGAVCDEELDAIVLRATAPLREMRYRTAAEFASALKDYFERFAGLAMRDDLRAIMADLFAERTARVQHLLERSRGAFARQEDSALSALPGYRSMGNSPSMSTSPLPAGSPQSYGFGSSHARSSYPQTQPFEGAWPSGHSAPMFAASPTTPPPTNPAHRSLTVVVGMVGGGFALALCAAGLGWFFGGAQPRTVSILSEPEGAQVWVDGAVRGEAPMNIEVSGKSSVNLSFRLHGYKTARRSITPGELQDSIHVAMERAEDFGTLVIESSPPGANIVVDGKDTGQKTPAVLERLWIGAPHTVVVTLEDYAPVVREVRFAQQRAETVRIAFQHTDRGFVKALCEPSPCAVEINGKPSGETPLLRKAVAAPASVHIVLRQRDVVVKEGEFFVQPGAFHEIVYKEPVRKKKKKSKSSSRKPTPQTTAPVPPTPTRPESSGKQALHPPPQKEKTAVTRVFSPESRGDDSESIVSLTAQVGSPKAQGSISTEALETVVGGLSPAVRRCYRQAYNHAPFAGRLQVRFTLNAQGRAREVHVVGEGGPGMEACVLSAVVQTSFPVPESTRAQVSFPVALRAEGVSVSQLP